MFTHAPPHHPQDGRGGDVENPPSDHLSSSEILTNRPDRVVLKVDQETFSNGKNLLCVARGLTNKVRPLGGIREINFLPPQPTGWFLPRKQTALFINDPGKIYLDPIQGGG
jgi:hypothetical protein